MNTIKKIITFCLALSMITSFIPNNAFAAADTDAGAAANATNATNAANAMNTAANAEDNAAAGASPAKDGYTLVPALYGKTGVDVRSLFILTTPGPATYETLAASLSIDGQPAPDIVPSGLREANISSGVKVANFTSGLSGANGSSDISSANSSRYENGSSDVSNANGSLAENEFIITPAATLSPNSLYIFRLSRELEGKADITWAFQTAKKFLITSSFPRNQAIDVPVRSGIEITFSEEGYTPIDSYFNISPDVDGSFEYHKNTAVFVPKSLKHKTVYTVTLKAGVKLEGTNDALAEDYEFAFETAAEPSYKPPTYYESIYFYSRYVELPTIEAPRVGFRISYSRGNTAPNPKIVVYKFGDSEKAVESIKAITSAPLWSRYAKAEDQIDTYGLSEVMSFDAGAGYDEDSGYLMLPDNLSQGFYLLDATLGDNSRDQMIIQISDLSVQVIADNDKAIIWVNEISGAGGNAGGGGAGGGDAAAGAAVYDVREGKTYMTDAGGIAIIDRKLTTINEREQFNITSADGKTCVWLYDGYGNEYYGSGTWQSGEAYWTALRLDRSLFKRDDTISFFGFAQDRKNIEEIEYVTAVLTLGYSYNYGYGYNSYNTRDVLLKKTIPVLNGVYSDEIKLPNLESGSYNLTINHDDIVLGSTYFSVEDYVKPPYKIEAAADKIAVFSGDTVTFTAKAGFFEGTPVADLDVSYNFYSSYSDLTTTGYGESKTDAEGIIEVSEKIVPEADAQGQTNLSFTAEATLPEIGLTSARANVRVFINDIDIDMQAKRTGRNATLAVNVNSITLDRINGGDAKSYNDYLGDPVAGLPLTAEVYRVYYDKIKSGDYYDYIEKRVMSTYRYERKEEIISEFGIVTDADGKAEKAFTVPDRKYESYYARLTCTDGNGRKITQTSYVGYDYSSYWRNANSNECYLDAGEDEYGGKTGRYGVGDEVILTLKRVTETVEKGNFLFVTMQHGILSWQAGKNPYSFKFSRDHIPNITVNAYYFNGYNYQSGYYMNKNILFDYSSRDLTLTAIADKETYKPGDQCSITVTAKDDKGAPIIADVNISVVDEAFFALRNYNVDTLASLYRTLNPGLRFTAATHRAYVPALDKEASAEAGTGAGGAADENAPMAMAPEPEESRGKEDTYLREEFKDTAFFETMRTDRRGEAVYTFKLPDNITSWRLTISGVSGDLYAGNDTQNIIVTNPMFINYSFNDVFLAGDAPAIGVNAYGASLSGGETVDFEVWDENAPDAIYRASGAAFERVNIPLWTMNGEGEGALIVKATTGSGASDAIRHQYQVLGTYREMDEAVYYDVTADTVFDVGNGGLTNITFTDQGRGAFLRQLLYLRGAGWGGDRIEKLLAQREADKIIRKYFPGVYLGYYSNSFDPDRYQQSDGGIAILPHAESDLETTVKLMPYIMMEEININSLKNYLHNAYEDENAVDKMCALYGLALLKEPVLLDLNNYAMLDELSVTDAVYIALGYLALGETEAASELYDNRVAPKLEKTAPYYRVNTGADQDDILEATSAANLLASKLEKPEKDGLYQYCIDNYATDILINIEKLSHIEREIAVRTSAKGSVKYSLYGEEFTREIENGSSYTIRIPAQNMGEFKLLEVTGDVGAVSVYKIPMTEIGEVDNDIIVRRRYYKADNDVYGGDVFGQGDLIKVQIWIDYSAKAIQGSYCVTDYLPSGLAYVADSAKIDGDSGFGYGYYRYCTVEGQKVTFYDYNKKFDAGYIYYYYARVINPGTFKAEGPFVQNLTAKDVYTIGEDSTMTIK